MIHAITMNMPVKNEFADYRDRPEGSVSKRNTVGDGIKVLMTIFNLFISDKPMPFFSALALMLPTLLGKGKELAALCTSKKKKIGRK